MFFNPVLSLFSVFAFCYITAANAEVSNGRQTITLEPKIKREESVAAIINANNIIPSQITDLAAPQNINNNIDIGTSTITSIIYVTQTRG